MFPFDCRRPLLWLYCLEALQGGCGEEIEEECGGGKDCKPGDECFLGELCGVAEEICGQEINGCDVRNRGGKKCEKTV